MYADVYANELKATVSIMNFDSKMNQKLHLLYTVGLLICAALSLL